MTFSWALRIILEIVLKRWNMFQALVQLTASLISLLLDKGILLAKGRILHLSIQTLYLLSTQMLILKRIEHFYNLINTKSQNFILYYYNRYSNISSIILVYLYKFLNILAKLFSNFIIIRFF